MRIKIEIEIEAPEWVKALVSRRRTPSPKKRPRWFIPALIPSLFLLGTVTVVHADGIDVPHQFKDGDVLSADKLNTNFSALASVTRNPKAECPRGYERDPNVTNIVSCKRGADEVVRVGVGSGSGPSANVFWIDRYEASVWTTPNALPASQVRDNDGDVALAGLPRNGQFDAQPSPVYALSVSGVLPARYVTWFQAMEACAASEKVLPGGQEWLRAARRTPDGAGCQSNGADIRMTGEGALCQSVWGAQDMIGNLWEWTAEWYAGLGDAAGNYVAWPDDSPGGNYGGDGTWNISSSAISGSSATKGLPAAAWRGGDFGGEKFAGVFSMYLGAAPSDSYVGLGFRCMIPHQ